MLTRKFGRTHDHRLSLLRNLATSVILFERVTTTLAKAKEIRSVVEGLITIGKEGSLTSYRRLLAMVFDPKAAKKIMEELAPRYKDVTGGYVRVVPLMPRRGDAAPRALVELRGVTPPSTTPKEKKKEGGETRPRVGKSPRAKQKKTARKPAARKKAR